MSTLGWWSPLTGMQALFQRLVRVLRTEAGAATSALGAAALPRARPAVTVSCEALGAGPAAAAALPRLARPEGSASSSAAAAARLLPRAPLAGAGASSAAAAARLPRAAGLAGSASSTAVGSSTAWRLPPRLGAADLQHEGATQPVSPQAAPILPPTICVMLPHCHTHHPQTHMRAARHGMLKCGHNNNRWALTWPWRPLPGLPAWRSSRCRTSRPWAPA